MGPNLSWPKPGHALVERTDAAFGRIATGGPPIPVLVTMLMTPPTALSP